MKKVKYLRLKKFKKIIFTKSFIGSVVFAIALWGYTNLNKLYTTYIQVPFKVLLPQSRAIENMLPSEISVEVRGSGWQLFHLLMFNTSVECSIDLSSLNNLDSAFNISRNELLKSIKNLNLQTIEVNPQNIILKTGVVGEYVVPVQPNIIVKPREGFTVVGDIEIKPDLIVLSGNEQLVSNITKWSTQKVVFEDVFEPISAEIPLSDSLNNIIRISQTQVTANIDIQYIGEKTIYDVKLKIHGGSLPSNHTLMPSRIKVTVRGGVYKIAELVPEDIEATIDFKDIINDSTGIIKPKVLIPKNYEIVSIEPRYIYHLSRYPSYRSFIAQKSIIIR